MKLRKNRFTLVELLVVIAIISILAGMAIGVMGLASRKMADSKTQALIQKISVALENYKAKYGTYIPSNFEYSKKNISAATFETSIQATVFYIDHPDFFQFIDFETIKNKDATVVSGGDRFYLVDGYGKPLIYTCPGYFNKGGFDLGSVGADGYWGNTTTPTVTLPLAPTNSNYKDQFGKGDDITNFKR